MTSEIEFLRAENARLHDRVRLLESRCGHLMVDADRREERARKEAESCAAHGKEIQYLRHTASWYWAAMGQQERARQTIVTALLLLVRDELSHRAEPVPVDLLTKWIHRACDAQNKVMHRPCGYPTLADCLRGDGCNHSGLSDGLKAEIMETLGLDGSCGQAVLFGAR